MKTNNKESFLLEGDPIEEKADELTLKLLE